MRDEVGSLLPNYALRLGATAVQIAVSVVTVPLLLRLLSQEDYGGLSLYASASGLLLLPFAWVPMSTVRFGREEVQETDRAAATFWSPYAVLLPVAVLVLAASIWQRERIGAYLGADASVVQVFLVSVAWSALSHPLNGMLQATGRMKAFSLLPLLSQLFLVLAIAAMLLGAAPAHLLTVVGFGLAGQVTLTGATLAAVGARRLLPPRFDPQRLRRMLRFGVPLLLGGASTLVINFVDVSLLKLMDGDNATVGAYAAAYRIVELLYLAPMLSVDLLFPVMVAMVAAGRLGGLDHYAQRIVPQLAWLWMALLVPVALLADVVTVVVGGEPYQEAARPFSILVVGLGFRGFLSLYSPLLASRDRVGWLAGVSVFQAVLNTVLDWVLIPTLGIAGPALATAVTWGAAATVETLLIATLLPVRNARLLLLPVLVAGAAVAVLLEAPAPARLALAVVLAAILAGIARRARLFREEDLALYRRVGLPRFLERAVALALRPLTTREPGRGPEAR